MKTEPDILELLGMHESALGGFYAALAERFPDRREFWQKLADDESRHSRWCESFRENDQWERWLRTNSRLMPQAIRSSLDYVRTQTERVGELSILEALSVSRDMEEALLEKQFSRMDMHTAPPEIRAVLEDLAAETVFHRKIISEALAAEKDA